MQQFPQALVGVAYRQLCHSPSHGGKQGWVGLGLPQAMPQQSLDGVAQRWFFWIVLMHDHRATQCSGAGGVGLLVLVRSLGEGHQNRRCVANRQLAEAAGTGSADGQIGVLQQTGNSMQVICASAVLMWEIIFLGEKPEIEQTAFAKLVAKSESLRLPQ